MALPPGTFFNESLITYQKETPLSVPYTIRTDKTQLQAKRGYLSHSQRSALLVDRELDGPRAVTRGHISYLEGRINDYDAATTKMRDSLTEALEVLSVIEDIQQMPIAPIPELPSDIVCLILEASVDGKGGMGKNLTLVSKEVQSW